MKPRFQIHDTPIPGLRLVQRDLVGDERGFLDKLYDADALGGLLPGRVIAQVNFTRTRHAGTVRGLHFQHPPHAECKLVSCLRGEVYDVAVDLRRGSPTFLRWHAERLGADNRRSLLIPEGFAHGFQALEADCDLLYLHTASHVPEAEGGLHPQDPRLAIRWPLPVALLSSRDAGHALLDDGFAGVAP